MTYKQPEISLAIPLSLTILYYLILFFIVPIYFWSGMLWKIIILMGPRYGYFGVRKSDKILRENDYLASELGFSKIKNK